MNTKQKSKPSKKQELISTEVPEKKEVESSAESSAQTKENLEFEPSVTLHRQDGGGMVFIGISGLLKSKK